MKTVRAKYQHFTTQVPILGGKSITFVNFVAEVEDMVADYLAGSNPSFYVIEKQTIKKETESVLVVRDMGLGDVIMVTALLRKLRAIGIKRIGMACYRDYIPVFDGNPNVDKVYEMSRDTGAISLNGDQYDQKIDLRMYVENAENSQIYGNRVAAFCRAAELPIKDESEMLLDYFVTDRESSEADATVASVNHEHRRTACIIYESSTANRNWNQGKVISVIEALVSNGWFVVVTHHMYRSLGPNLTSNPYVLNTTASGYNIRQSVAIMNVCDVVVTPDTGFFHIASALRKPVVGYFGAFPMSERYSHNKRVELNVKHNCNHLPCRNYYCLNKTGDGTPRCIDIDPKVVCESVKSLYDQYVGGPK